jgi:hypothetical protein
MALCFPPNHKEKEMAAKHKFSGSHILISTSLPAWQAAEVTKDVGEQTKFEGPLGPRVGGNHVRFEGAQPGRVNFSVRAFKDIMEVMTFHVTIDSNADVTSIRSIIDGFKTSQQKLFYLIPLGPKQMLAYKTYHLFMRNLGAAFAKADPGAKAAITEQPATSR